MISEIRITELEALEMVIKKVKRGSLKNILTVQQHILRAVDDYMLKSGVVRMMPLMMAPITDTLSHSVEETELNYCDQKFDVMKSMIFHKQLTLMNEGLDKIYIVSPNIRLERPEKDDIRHLFEFTQIDFEFKDNNMEDVLKFMEDIIGYVFTYLRENCPKEIQEVAGGLDHLEIETPFKRYRTEELMEIYGENFEEEISKKEDSPFFILNHKREFYDAEDMEKPGTYKNYDLIWPRGFLEGLSGGEREYKYERIIKRMEENGSSQEVFRNYLEVAKRGLLHKSAGAGFGVERITRYVLQLPEVDATTVFTRKPGVQYIF